MNVASYLQNILMKRFNLKKELQISLQLFLSGDGEIRTLVQHGKHQAFYMFSYS